MVGIRLICSLAAFSFLAASCAKYDHEVKVTDVRKAEVILLKKEVGKGFVHGIDIRVKGYVDGEAKIFLTGSSSESEQLTGEIDFTWGGDWYSDVAEIRYEPINVKSGDLAIQYFFATLDEPQ